MCSGLETARRATVSLLAERVDYVIGVDTHLHSHTAAVLTATGELVASARIEAEEAGWVQLVQLAGRKAPGSRGVPGERPPSSRRCVAGGQLQRGRDGGNGCATHSAN